MVEFHLIRPKNADFISNDSDFSNVSLMSSNGIVQSVRINSLYKPGHEPDGHSAFFSTFFRRTNTEHYRSLRPAAHDGQTDLMVASLPPRRPHFTGRASSCHLVQQVLPPLPALRVQLGSCNGAASPTPARPEALLSTEPVNVVQLLTVASSISTPPFPLRDKSYLYPLICKPKIWKQRVQTPASPDSQTWQLCNDGLHLTFPCCCSQH